MNVLNAGTAPVAISKIGLQRIKIVIWVYFWLLLFEGAIRKWVLPELSSALLIVRDPVALLAYFLAFRYELLKGNKALLFIGVVAFCFATVSFFQYILTDDYNLLVILFGLRTNFLHLPLIVLMGDVFNRQDVARMGKWIVVFAALMAILIIVQFRSPPDDILNRTASGEGHQIASSMGKIRPPGLFSYITGVSQFYALASAFVVAGAVESAAISRIILCCGGCGILATLAVSGSRLAIISAALVIFALLFACSVNTALLKKSYRFAMLLVIVACAIGSTDFFEEGIVVLNSRLDEAAATEGTADGGVSDRVIGGFIEPFQILLDTPVFGHGLGMGTNVGAMLISGKAVFLLAEGEWLRIVLESGAVLGLLYLMLRVGLAVWLGRYAFCSARRGDALPIVLFAACAPILINGAFGQATTVGFAALSAGLCLAACRNPATDYLQK